MNGKAHVRGSSNSLRALALLITLGNVASAVAAEKPSVYMYEDTRRLVSLVEDAASLDDTRQSPRIVWTSTLVLAGGSHNRDSGIEPLLRYPLDTVYRWGGIDTITGEVPATPSIVTVLPHAENRTLQALGTNPN